LESQEALVDRLVGADKEEEEELRLSGFVCVNFLVSHSAARSAVTPSLLVPAPSPPVF